MSKDKDSSWTDLATGMGAIWSAAGALAAMSDSLPSYRRAFELVPGDVIRLGHIHVYVVRVTLSNVVFRHSYHQIVDIAGAEAKWKHHDWWWNADMIMEDIPLLSFHPLERVEVAKRSEMDTLEGCIKKLKAEAETLKAQEEEEAQVRRLEIWEKEEELRDRIREEVREEVLAEIEQEKEEDEKTP